MIFPPHGPRPKTGSGLRDQIREIQNDQHNKTRDAIMDMIKAAMDMI
jgi:hypothetical protein